MADMTPGGGHVQTDEYASRRRSSEVQRHLRSSGVKKKKIKERHCYFCILDDNNEAFANHLQRSRSCRALYMRLFKVTSLENLLQSLFSCEVCFLSGTTNFAQHLHSNRGCLEAYRMKYGLHDVQEIVNKKKTLKRRLIQSRSRVARRLEYKNHKQKKLANKTTFSSLNDFRSNTMFFNFKHCVLCKANFGGLSARELKPTEDLYKSLNVNSEEWLKSRRFEKTFICSMCENQIEEGSNNNVEEDTVQLGELIFEAENKIIFFPTDQEVNKKLVEQEKILMLLPGKIEATKILSESASRKIKPNRGVVRKMYESDYISNAHLKAIYDTEMSKYKMRDEVCYAVIADKERKTLSDIMPSLTDSRIPGSFSWFSQKKYEILARRDQFGDIFITFGIEISSTSPNILATILINEGVVVTGNLIGTSVGQVEIEYMVHAHDNSVDCMCEANDLTKLSEYIRTGAFDDVTTLYRKHVGTVVSAAHQTFKSFIKDIVSAPGSELFSENFYFILVFDVEGNSSIIGCIWPKQLDAVNIDIANNGGRLTDKEPLLKYVEQNFSASSDARLLRTIFTLSEKEAKDLSMNVMKYQHDENIEPELPSLETDFKDKFATERNVKSSQKLRDYMKHKLKSLRYEEASKLSTKDWLDREFETVTGDLEVSQEMFLITTEHDENIVFDIDERLLNLLNHFEEDPLYAIYQYSLTTGFKVGDSSIVFKRPSIKDCYTKVYNQFLLQACGSSLSITFSNNSDQFESFLSSSQQVSNPEGITRADLLLSHRLVNITEALSQADKTKSRIYSSTPSQFINAKPNRQVMVKQVSCEGPSTFKLQGTTQFYELIPDLIGRHFNKRNGNLLLVETCLWYDFIGGEKSKEVFKLYDEKLDDIPNSEVEGVLGGNLPKFLLCSNGDVLQIRKCAKVLLTPNPKSEYERMYQKCLLFSPINNEGELLQHNLTDKFLEMNEEEGEKVVVVNEKKMFKYKMCVKECSNEKSNDNGVDDIQDVPDDYGQNDESDFALDKLLEILSEEC